jgi:hypothetical protein
VSSSLYKDKNRGKVCISALATTEPIPYNCRVLRLWFVASIVKQINQMKKQLEYKWECRFRHVDGIEALEDKRLEELGYYRGLPLSSQPYHPRLRAALVLRVREEDPE